MKKIAVTILSTVFYLYLSAQLYDKSFLLKINTDDTLHALFVKSDAYLASLNDSSISFVTSCKMSANGVIEESIIKTSGSVNSFDQYRLFLLLKDGRYLPAVAEELVIIFSKGISLIQRGIKGYPGLVLSKKDYEKYQAEFLKRLLIQNVVFELSACGGE